MVVVGPKLVVHIGNRGHATPACTVKEINRDVMRHYPTARGETSEGAAFQHSLLTSALRVCSQKCELFWRQYWQRAMNGAFMGIKQEEGFGVDVHASCGWVVCWISTSCRLALKHVFVRPQSSCLHKRKRARQSSDYEADVIIFIDEFSKLSG
jgi:hypothetical protein